MPPPQSSEAASELLAEKDAEIQRLRAELDEAKKGSDDAPAVLGREALTRMKESFEMVDTDQSGSIAAEEVHKVMCGWSAGEGLPMPSEGQASAMVAQFDANNSGQIEFEEFVVMMLSLRGMVDLTGLIVSVDDVEAGMLREGVPTPRARSADQPFTLTVRGAADGAAFAVPDVKRSNTLADLRGKIQLAHPAEPAPERQVLLIGGPAGTVLEPETRTLDDCDVHERVTLWLRLTAMREQEEKELVEAMLSRDGLSELQAGLQDGKFSVAEVKAIVETLEGREQRAQEDAQSSKMRTPGCCTAARPLEPAPLHTPPPGSGLTHTVTKHAESQVDWCHLCAVLLKIAASVPVAVWAMEVGSLSGAPRLPTLGCPVSTVCAMSHCRCGDANALCS